MLDTTAAPRERKSHIWNVEANEHYVEQRWVARRLLEEERFDGDIVDPCCGFGRIPEAAKALGLQCRGYDLVDRGYAEIYATIDFLRSDIRADNFVMNPPFSLGREFALHALKRARRKVAIIYPTRRLAAAGSWLRGTPHYRTWYLTPRPSMPPGQVALEYERQGKEPSGGKQDFCVLVWLHGFDGYPQERWLHRDGAQP